PVNFRRTMYPRRGAGGIVEATSARRSRGNATGDAPELYRTKPQGTGQMLRRYAGANALFAFTRCLRPQFKSPRLRMGRPPIRREFPAEARWRVQAIGNGNGAD
ncbi:MAG: hypothetical protein V3R53_01335, partial [Gammaproteobacteria bacterium]